MNVKAIGLKLFPWKSLPNHNLLQLTSLKAQTLLCGVVSPFYNGVALCGIVKPDYNRV